MSFTELGALKTWAKRVLPTKTVNRLYRLKQAVLPSATAESVEATESHSRLSLLLETPEQKKQFLLRVGYQTEHVDEIERRGDLKAKISEAMGSMEEPEVKSLTRLFGAGSHVGEKRRAILETRGFAEPVIEALSRSPHEAVVGAKDFFWGAVSDPVTIQLLDDFFGQAPDTLDALILVPALGRGGGELVAIHHANSINRSGGSVVVVGTDFENQAWVTLLDPGVRFIDLHAMVRNAYGHPQGGWFAAQFVGDVIRKMDVKHIHSVNSYAGAILMKSPPVGNEKRYLSLFGVGKNKHGHLDGYWQEAASVASDVTFVADNAALPDRYAPKFGVDRRRVVSFAYPTIAHVQDGVRTNLSGRVLWASRLDPEKIPEVVLEVAKKNPRLKFDMFGSGVLTDYKLDRPPPNLKYRGAFDGLSSIDVAAYDCFLFTSLWEGLPNILIEALSVGLPVVASDVGAISELVSEDVGILVKSSRDVDAYSAALAKILSTLESRNQFSVAATKKMRRERSLTEFDDAMRRVGYAQGVGG